MPDVKKQYIVCPGLIPSVVGMIYVSAPELMRFYHVKSEECFILESGESATDLPLNAIELSNMVYLRP